METSGHPLLGEEQGEEHLGTPGHLDTHLGVALLPIPTLQKRAPGFRDSLALRKMGVQYLIAAGLGPLLPIFAM
jgi:hypothetical protein